MDGWLYRNFVAWGESARDKKTARALAIGMTPFLGAVLTQSIGDPPTLSNSAATSLKDAPASEFMIIVPPGCELIKSCHNKLRTRGDPWRDPTVRALSNYWIGRDNSTSHAARLSEHPSAASFGLPFCTIIYNKMISFAGQFRFPEYISCLESRAEFEDSPDIPRITHPVLNSSGICMFRADMRIRGTDIVIACWPRSINILKCEHEAEVAGVAETLLESLLPFLAIVSPDPQIKVIPLVVSFRVPGKYMVDRAREIARLAGHEHIVIAETCPFVISLDVAADADGGGHELPIVFVRSDGIVFYRDTSLLEAVRITNLFLLGAISPCYATMHTHTQLPMGPWRSQSVWLQVGSRVEPTHEFSSQAPEGWHVVLCGGEAVWNSFSEFYITRAWAQRDGGEVAHISDLVRALRAARTVDDLRSVGCTGLHSCAWRPGDFNDHPVLDTREPAPPPARFTRDATEWVRDVLSK